LHPFSVTTAADRALGVAVPPYLRRRIIPPLHVHAAITYIVYDTRTRARVNIAWVCYLTTSTYYLCCFCVILKKHI